MKNNLKQRIFYIQISEIILDSVIQMNISKGFQNKTSKNIHFCTPVRIFQKRKILLTANSREVVIF